MLGPTIQLNVRVRQDVRTALELVSRICGVRWADIIEVAPLLFLITGLKSLAMRKDTIKSIVEKLDGAVADSIRAAPHLTPAFFSGYDYEAIERERESIKKREIFGPFDYFDVEDHDPYVNYLRRLLDDLPEAKGLVDISPSIIRRAPEYTISEHILRQMTGITAETEQDQKLLDFISDGDIDLREFLSKNENLSESDYNDWLSNKCKEVAAKREVRFPRLDLSKLNLSTSRSDQNAGVKEEDKS